MTIKGVPFIAILGQPKIGKTRLAATFPNPLVIDTELGAGSAFPENRRAIISPDDKCISHVTNIVDKIAGSPYADKTFKYKRITGDIIDVNTLIVDSIDGLQDPLKYMLISARPKTVIETPTGKVEMPGTMRDRDWGILLAALEPLILKLRALPIPTILVAHTKSVDPFEGDLGSRSFSVQGALKEKMPRWFDLIAHLIPGPDNNSRIAIVQPKIVQKYAIMAGDRHNIFGTDEVKITAKNGFPDGEFAKKVLTAYDY